MAKEKSETAAQGAKGRVRIRMIGSVIGCPEKQRATVRGLGLRRLHQVVEREDTPAVRGMVKKVPHLVEIVET
jgi:large subunit ribosomal protein L30